MAVGEPQIEPRIERKPGAMQILEPPKIHRVGEVPLGVGLRHEPFAFVADRRHPDADRRGVGESARRPGGGGQAQAFGDAESSHETQRVGPVVLEGIAQAVRFPLRLPVRVGNPAGHPGCGVKSLQIDVDSAGDAPAPVHRVDGDLGGGRHARRQFLGKVNFGESGKPFGVGLKPADE